jgi:hypothetical protein
LERKRVVPEAINPRYRQKVISIFVKMSRQLLRKASRQSYIPTKKKRHDGGRAYKSRSIIFGARIG